MILPIILTFLIIIILLTVGGGLLALLVYGLGWLLHLITKFDLFQATLLGLASMFAFGYLAERVLSAILNYEDIVQGKDLYEDFEEDIYEYVEEDKRKNKDAQTSYPGIPRWRQPLKQVDFSQAKPNDLCPCGSGRKFKHCHGVKRTA